MSKKHILISVDEDGNAEIQTGGISEETTMKAFCPMVADLTLKEFGKLLGIKSLGVKPPLIDPTKQINFRGGL